MHSPTRPTPHSPTYNSHVRLPLQIGRASLNQGARFAGCVWLGPLLLILAAAFMDSWGPMLAAFGLGLPAIFFMSFAFTAAELAAADRASDIVLDVTGFVIEGGPLDKTHCTWSEVDDCDIVTGDGRWALRWLLLSWLTARRFDAINDRASVPVKQLQLSRKGSEKVVLAEAEGDEIESLEPLRDSIRAAIAPPNEPAPLPQEILTCPHCDAPLVPAPKPRMTCTYCHQELDVPAELQQRVRASIELDENSGSRASVIHKLVDQPSARRAGLVIASCRRLMVWIQPVTLGLLVAMMVHSTHGVAHPAGISVARAAPGDDGLFFYDLALLALVVAGAFAIAWSVGHAYIANRQALRTLADNFGAVPPAKTGAPSTCHQCNAPLPTSTALLVHCAYCAAENVFGVDPRPAAMRRKRERVDLARGLRRRRRSQIQRWITIPLSVVLTVAMVREVRLAWNVPDRFVVPEYWTPQMLCTGHCGHVANADPIRRTFTIVAQGKSVETTVLPHGSAWWDCEYDCTIEIGRTRVTPNDVGDTNLRIEHGVLKPAP